MKALIVGLGKSGKSAIKFLKKLGYRTYIIDDKKSYKYELIRDRLLSGLSLVVVSPGVSYEHVAIQDAIKKGICVIGELELGAMFLNGETYAITGTNGKTTTTTLVNEILSKSNDNTFMGGNIGIPVTSFAQKTNNQSKTVLEVSSFQLESINKFRPHIAVILNISPDHLNRHKTMENYINAKLNIFKNQTESDFLILNLDDEILMRQDFSSAKSKILYYSTKQECEGCFIQEGNIYFKQGENKVYIMKAEEVLLKGEHNLSNALSAILLSVLSDIAPENIAQIIHNFKGVNHRLEYVCEIDGVSFINDSKATNISSTIVAMNSMTEPTTLILGGSDKGYTFDELFEKKPPLIKNIIVLGETKQKILDSANRYLIENVFAVKTMKEAVKLGFGLAERGEVVLLSPACASFDMFKDYEQRGVVFKKLVRRQTSVVGKKK